MILPLLNIRITDTPHIVTLFYCIPVFTHATHQYYPTIP